MSRRTKPGDQDRKKLAEKIFQHMREGLSAHKACAAVGLHQSTFNHWLNDDAELAAEYSRARDDLIEKLASDIIAIADQEVGTTDNGSTDSGAVQDKRVRIDARKWALSKMAPKKYGDRIEIAGDNAAPLKVEHAIDVSKLSTDALAQIVAARKAADAD